MEQYRIPGNWLKRAAEIAGSRSYIQIAQYHAGHGYPIPKTMLRNAMGEMLDMMVSPHYEDAEKETIKNTYWNIVNYIERYSPEDLDDFRSTGTVGQSEHKHLRGIGFNPILWEQYWEEYRRGEYITYRDLYEDVSLEMDMIRNSLPASPEEYIWFTDSVPLNEFQGAHIELTPGQAWMEDELEGIDNFQLLVDWIEQVERIQFNPNELQKYDRSKMSSIKELLLDYEFETIDPSNDWDYYYELGPINWYPSDGGEWARIRDVGVAQYKGLLPEEAPIAILEDGSLIDGAHRIAWAKYIREWYLPALVGVPENYFQLYEDNKTVGAKMSPEEYRDLRRGLDEPVERRFNRWEHLELLCPHYMSEDPEWPTPRDPVAVALRIGVLSNIDITYGYICLKVLAEIIQPLWEEASTVGEILMVRSGEEFSPALRTPIPYTYWLGDRGVGYDFVDADERLLNLLNNIIDTDTSPTDEYFNALDESLYPRQGEYGTQVNGVQYQLLQAINNIHRAAMYLWSTKNVYSDPTSLSQIIVPVLRTSIYFYGEAEELYSFWWRICRCRLATFEGRDYDAND